MRVRIGGTVLTLGVRQAAVCGIIIIGISFVLYVNARWAWTSSSKARDLGDDEDFNEEEEMKMIVKERPRRMRKSPVVWPKNAAEKEEGDVWLNDDRGRVGRDVDDHRQPMNNAEGRRRRDGGDGDRDVRPAAWPNNARNPFRLDDLNRRKNATSSAESSAFAMDVVRRKKSKYEVIQNVQRQLIRNQKRAPDSRYNINVTNSDLQSLDRDVLDVRPAICRHFTYDLRSLPKASVIIPFYNEALTMLLRTVHSVLNRSPDSLLVEVILVDDCSTDEHLKEPLAQYLRLLPKVTLLRNENRVGLIVSRMNGAAKAKGQVVIFLDAHTEVNRAWLEPLLDEIRLNRKQVLQPFVDAIDAMSLEIGPAGVYHVGAFSWDLRYTWLRLSEHTQKLAEETGLPFFTPTLVGCAIAVDKEYFLSIGSFDEGLRIWGGENIELGFRAWQCGGKVTTVTCSHVGHVFKEFPYTFDGNKEDTVQKNLIRVSETWMDGLKKFFYASTRVYDFKGAELDADELVSLAERKRQRTKMGCRNFEWYLYNVVPEVEIPPTDAIFYGEIANVKSNACWEVTEDYRIAMTYVCYKHKIIPENNFALTEDGLLRYKDRCVKIAAPSPVLALAECPSTKTAAGKEELENFGVWELEKSGTVSGSLKVTRRNPEGFFEYWCVVQVTNVLPPHRGKQMPQLGGCKQSDEFQKWAFTYAFDFSLVP